MSLAIDKLAVVGRLFVAFEFEGVRGLQFRDLEVWANWNVFLKKI
jgi:hypothetical protein